MQPSRIDTQNVNNSEREEIKQKDGLFCKVCGNFLKRIILCVEADG